MVGIRLISLPITKKIIIINIKIGDYNMEIVIKLNEQDLKDNLVINTITNLFKQKKTIVAPQVDIDDCDFVENVVKPKKKAKTKEERVTELKNYANSIYKDLSDAKKKSLKSFVAFYEKKIKEEDFNINPAKQFNHWWQHDKNNK